MSEGTQGTEPLPGVPDQLTGRGAHVWLILAHAGAIAAFLEEAPLSPRAPWRPAVLPRDQARRASRSEVRLLKRWGHCPAPVQPHWAGDSRLCVCVRRQTNRESAARMKQHRTEFLEHLRVEVRELMEQNRELQVELTAAESRVQALAAEVAAHAASADMILPPLESLIASCCS